MSPRDDDQDRLTRGLRERADRVHGTPLDLDTVRGRARGIQRRRRVVAGLAASAVVAVVVPLGLGLDGAARSERPVAPATTSPSPRTPTAPPSPAPTRVDTERPVPLVVQDAPTGEPPRVGFQRGTTYRSAEGDATQLDRDYLTLTPYRGGWIGIDRDERGETYLARIGADGKQTGRVPGGDRIVLDADGLRAAWFEANDDPRRRGALVIGTTSGHSEGEDGFEAFAAGTASLVGFLGTDVVYRLYGADLGTRFFVGPDGVAGSSDATGTSEIEDVLAIRDVDSSRRRLAVQTSFDTGRGTSCWEIRGLRGGPVSRSCDWSFDTFSPDGSLVVGYPSDVDGLGSSQVALIDVETGRPVVEFAARGQAFAAGVAWEDESHLLASVYDDDRWQLVRLGLDGSLEIADVAGRGGADTSPYHFGATS